MTPLILVILAAMWAAVLLPPYLRDKNETRAAGRRSPMRDRIDALTSSFSGGRSYVPVRGSGRSASQVPLPHGAKRAIAAPRGTTAEPGMMPQSSAVQIIGPEGERTEAHEADVHRLHPRDSARPEPARRTEATETHNEGRPAPRSGSAFARRRRRDVLHTLIGLAGITLVATLALGGPILFVHLLADVALVSYVYLLVQRRKVSAEQEMKVAFLPHGGNGASATALLEQGGGWDPGTRVDNLRVLRAEAN